MKKIITITAAAAIAIALTAPASATSSWSKVQDRYGQLLLMGKDKAEARACVDKAAKDASEIARRDGVEVDPLLDAFLKACDPNSWLYDPEQVRARSKSKSVTEEK